LLAAGEAASAHLVDEEGRQMSEMTMAVVADAARAQLLRIDAETGRWNPVEVVEHPEGRMHDRDLREYRKFPNAGTKYGPNVEDDPHGRHKLEADRFAKHLATELAQRFDGQLFNRLVLIAPPELMGTLRKELPKRVEAAIAEEITEDLSRLSPHELTEHFRRRHR